MRARHTPTHRRTGPSARTTRYTTLDLSRRTQKMFAQRTTAKVAPSAMRATASRGGRAVQARAGADRKMWCVARRRARGTVDDASVGGNFFRSFRVVHGSRYRSRPLVGRVALDGAHPYLRISRAISTLRVGGGSDALARAGTRAGGESAVMTTVMNENERCEKNARDDGSIDGDVNETTDDGATRPPRVGCRLRTRRRRTSTVPSPATTVSTRSAWAPTRNASSTTKRRNS